MVLNPRILFVLLCLGLGACAADSKMATAQYLGRNGITNTPIPDKFRICYGYGCKNYGDVHLTEDQWGQVQALFAGQSLSAAGERAAIAKAVGLLETFTGEQTFTSQDLGGNWRGIMTAGQQDCVDESTNSTTYLLLLAQGGVLRHHEVYTPQGRGHFIHGWPHFTAAVKDIETEEVFVVDSWFLDNGAKAQVVPLAWWTDGWSPTKENKSNKYKISKTGEWSPQPPWMKGL